MALRCSHSLRNRPSHWTDSVNSVAFSPDGKILASGDGYSFLGPTVKLWSVDNHLEIATLKGHNESVESVVFSPDGKTLASASRTSVVGADRDNTVKLWSVENRTEITTLKGHSASVYSVAFSPVGKILVSASSDGTILIWKAKP
ncbi:MAG: hypothetical protein O7E52_02070 [Candidatus Poribacteria bacterium]|nr:hypothetical protein [Candidatus Poribacteria bacterium]